ncbi:MAG: methylated-DNA--[protein]-cysteine S-methyltransferase [Clostridiales bacterium]|jgi:O-6-methylguanine DNA methyltransferase|nr:methylated-DNA--[protein]-cysteine S-methyltransferase [Clostridiales bacterium]
MNKELYILSKADGFAFPVTIISSSKGVQQINFAPLEAVARELTEKNIPFTVDLSLPASIELTQYFSGQRREFTIPIDIRGTLFQLQVWNALREIPYGQVASYKDIAIRIGRPNASRAVGQACGANPIPIIVPCHRVLTANHRLGGFSSGLEKKTALLELEGSYSMVQY